MKKPTISIPNNVTRAFGKACLKAKKHSPEVLIGVGVVGVVASAVMACKATLKVNDILDDAKKNIETIHSCAENPEFKEKYTEEDKKKDLTIVYARTGVDLIKLYGPAVVLGAVSIGCVLTSNKIIRERNAGLVAAYAALDQGFREYRGRVVERFGKDLDQELRYNIKATTVEERIVDEDGNEKVVSKTVETVDPTTHSDFSRFFDESCRGWEKDPEANMMFLKLQQNFANEKLQKKGYLFLNDVYEMLGLPKTKAGQIVGWVYDEKNPIGDNYVDFGLYNQERERVRAFVNGYEPVILLDFNVDGDILNYI